MHWKTKALPLRVSSCSKSWFEQLDNGIILHCTVLPKSSKTQIVGPYGVPPRLKIKIAAPPVDGEANEALIVYLAKYFKIPKSHFEILSGHAGKNKDIRIVGKLPSDFFKKTAPFFAKGGNGCP